MAASCRKMQYLAVLKDEYGVHDISTEEAIDKIRTLIPNVRKEYSEAKQWLINFLPADTGE